MSFKANCLVFVGLLVATCVFSAEPAAAYMGRGYYDRNTACTTDNAGNRDCYGTRISTQLNDVVPSGVGGTTKPSFKRWLGGISGTPSGRFIMDTMAGRNASMAEVNARIDNPDVTLQVITDLPRKYGSISFRGKDQFGRWDYFFTGEYYPSARQMLIFRHKGRIVYILETRCANPIGGLPGLPATPTASCSYLSTPVITNRTRVALSSRASAGNGATISSHVFTIHNAAGTQINQHRVNTGSTRAETTFVVNAPGRYTAKVAIVTSEGIKRSRSCEQPFRIQEPGGGPTPTAACTRLTTSKIGRTRVRLRSTASVSNGATISSHIFTIQTSSGTQVDERRVNTGSTSASFTKELPVGRYIARVAIITSEGRRESSACRRTFTIEPPTMTTIRGYLDLSSSSSGGNNLTNGIVETGETVYVHSGMENTGSARGRARFERIVWWERSGVDARFDGSDIEIDTERGTATVNRGNRSPIPRVSEDASLDDDQLKLCAQLTLAAVNTADELTTIIGDAVIVRCVEIGRTPTLHVWGNDIRVGGDANPLSARFGITASAKSKLSSPSRTFGSWGEYGVFATGPIAGFSSAAQFKRGVAGVDPPDANAIDQLTFANTGSIKGRYTNSANINPLSRGEIKEAYESTPTSSNNIQLTGRFNQTGTRIIKTTGDVTITGNQQYRSGSFGGGAGALPQTIIIADNIYIAPNVARVDAWLVADNTIDTCAGVDNLTVKNGDRCNRQLRINGPVIANTLKLKRTYADPDDKAKPAETINLRSDAYIWAQHRYSRSGASNMRTSYISELPPRY